MWYNVFGDGMKKRGFTLVELLGVLVLISVLALIAIPTIINVINRKESEISEATNQLIVSGAEMYVDANKSEFPGIIDRQYCVTLEKLVDANYLSAPIMDSLSGKEISLNSYVKINYSYDIKLNQYKYDYEVSDTCQEMTYTCVGATPETVTTGNIPEGNYNVGDEYICQVKPDKYYHFFVVSVDGTTANLIMDSNVNSNGEPIKSSKLLDQGVTYWLGPNDFGSRTLNSAAANGTICKDYNICIDNSMGPVTAMKYLHNATDDWSSIPNIAIDYTDEGNTGSYGYGKIKTSGTTTTITDKSGKTTATFNSLKARLPKISELEAAGCSDENQSCPIWLVNYIYNIDNIEKYSKLGAKATTIYGYWTLSTDKISYGSVRNIRFDGETGYDGVYYGYNYSNGEYFVTKKFGVRPVISVSDTKIKNWD